MDDVRYDGSGRGEKGRWSDPGLKRKEGTDEGRKEETDDKDGRSDKPEGLKLGKASLKEGTDEQRQGKGMGYGMSVDGLEGKGTWLSDKTGSAPAPGQRLTKPGRPKTPDEI